MSSIVSQEIKDQVKILSCITTIEFDALVTKDNFQEQLSTLHHGLVDAIRVYDESYGYDGICRLMDRMESCGFPTAFNKASQLLTIITGKGPINHKVVDLDTSWKVNTAC